jgi:hypothetical protein
MAPRRETAACGANRRDAPLDTRLLSPAQRALTWEHLLQQRLNAKVDREDE